MLSQVSMEHDRVTDMHPAAPCPLLTSAIPFRQIPQAAASMREGKWDRKKVGGGHSTLGRTGQWVPMRGALAHSPLCTLVHGHGAEREDTGCAGAGAHRQGGSHPHAGFWHEGKDLGQGGAMGSMDPPGLAASTMPGCRSEHPLFLRP